MSLNKKNLVVLEAIEKRGPEPSWQWSSVDVKEKKGTYEFITVASPKTISLKNKNLLLLHACEKKGDPKTAGISVDVYENKGQKF